VWKDESHDERNHTRRPDYASVHETGDRISESLSRVVLGSVRRTRKGLAEGQLGVVLAVTCSQSSFALMRLLMFDRGQWLRTR
jgi:hypothetical protein